MADSTKNPWTIAAESIAIVASILFAFAIDAWWEDRKEREFEQETLLGLKAEYEDHKRAIQRQKEFHLRSLRAIAGLMTACQHGIFESSEFSIDDAIYLLQVPSTTDLGNGVRDALIGAGRIEVLRNRQLRYELAEWDSVLDELTDGQLFSLAIVRGIVIPYLTRRGMPLSGAMDGNDRTPWPVPTQSISAEPAVTKRLLKDPEFCSMLDVRYGHMNHTLDEFDDLILSIDEILLQVEESIN